MTYELGKGTGPLRGVKVVEIAGIGPGPHACMTLADLGADVVRVEKPGGAASAGPREADLLTRGRPSVAMDLKNPAALAALAAAGVPDRVRVLDDHARTAAEAAASLGVGVAQIANSLVFVARPAANALGGSDPFPVLVMASGGHRVDTDLVARALGVDSVGRAKPDLVSTATGFVIGGVSPVGHLHPLPTLVDAALAELGEVWAAAGHPRTVFPTSHDELLRLTGGSSAVVAAD